MSSKNIGGFPFIRYQPQETETVDMSIRARAYARWLDTRRSVRDFSDRPIPLGVIEDLIRAASTAPSGAHRQPWTFCVVSNSNLKKQIREAAEREEHESYTSRMSEEWLRAIRPLQTDWHKPFLETAPHLIVVFKEAYSINSAGEKINNYYVNESVGIACGLLLTAIHHAGLVALTHTPSPMNFLSRILARPENERPFLLIPVGYPAPETYVPDLRRKPLSEVMKVYS
jgi:nitroreductase